MVLYSVLFCVVAILSFVNGDRERRHPNFPPAPAIPRVEAQDFNVRDKAGLELPPLNTTYFFDQLVDHDHPSKGTFKQRYWTSWQFYEPGGPIVLMTPGETNAEGFTGYLTNTTITGLISQANNGTTVILEHRFFGLSNPIDNLEDESLETLTIDQATKDLTYFAKNVILPQPGGGQVGPAKVPWILVGGSYSGALTSWTMVNQPGVFWAGYASSGVVEAIRDYWAYFEPIRQNMPKNCSADIQAVISHIDNVFVFGSTAQKQEIKEMFGMGDLTHLDDVAGALRNILWDWQSLQPSSGPNTTFFHSCDALEVKDGANAPESGWGLNHALPAFGAYFKDVYLPRLCQDNDPEDCLGTYNASQSFFTDTSVDNEFRSWNWMVCNEVGYLQEGAPRNWPSLVTRLVQPSYDERQCTYMFPRAFPRPRQANVATTNRQFKGWDVRLNRLFFANGKQDPWREATVSSDFHTRASTSEQPIFVGNGFHCSDLLVRAGVDPSVKIVTEAGVAQISNWIQEWPGNKANKPLKSVPASPAFTPSSIPLSVATATPEAVPAVATESTGSPPGVIHRNNHFAVPNAMIRQSVDVVGPVVA